MPLVIRFAEILKQSVDIEGEDVPTLDLHIMYRSMPVSKCLEKGAAWFQAMYVTPSKDDVSERDSGYAERDRGLHGNSYDAISTAADCDRLLFDCLEPGAEL